MHVFINSRLINFFHVIVSVITSSVRWTTWTENFENKKGVRRWPRRPPKLHQAIDNGPQCRQIWTDQSRHRTWIRTGQSGHRTRCLLKSSSLNRDCLPQKGQTCRWGQGATAVWIGSHGHGEGNVGDDTDIARIGSEKPERGVQNGIGKKIANDISSRIFRMNASF